MEYSCDHNCFDCRFEDCICPEDELTAVEEAEAEHRDRIAWKRNCPADYEENPELARKKAESDRKRHYREQNPEKIKAYNKAYYDRNRDKEKERQRRYYAENRERLDAYRSEKRRLKSAQQKAKKNKQERANPKRKE